MFFACDCTSPGVFIHNHYAKTTLTKSWLDSDLLAKSRLAVSGILLAMIHHGAEKYFLRFLK